MQLVTRTVLGMVAAGVAASACNAYEVRAGVVRMVAGATQVLTQDIDGCWILPAPVGVGEEVRLRLQIGVFGDNDSDAPAGGVVGWIDGSVSALCGVNSRTPGSIGPFFDPDHPEHNGVPLVDPFNSLTGIEGIWGIRPPLTWICNGGGYPPMPPPPMVGFNTYVPVYEITHEASGYAGCCTISIAGQCVSASEWRVVGTPVPPFCGNPNTPADDRPGVATYFPMTVPPVAFAACVRVCNALPGGGCTPVVGAHCWDDVGCIGIGPTYMTTITLECGEMHTDPNLFLASIVEFIDADGEVDLSDLALLLPGWDAVMRPTSTIIPSSVPDSPSIPNIVFRYRGTAPLLAPQVIGPFIFRRAASAPPIGTLRYATRTFLSGTPQTQWDTISFVPLPGSINDLTFRPLGAVQLSTTTVAGNTALLIDGITDSGNDGVRFGGCEIPQASGQTHGRVLPWHALGPAPLDAYVQVSLDGTGPRGTLVADVLQATLGPVGGDHVLHIGTNVSPAGFLYLKVEIYTGETLGQTYFIDPCETFRGFIPQSLCDFIISGFCYLNPGDRDCYCYENPGVCDGLGIDATFGTLSSQRLVQCTLRSARPFVIRRSTGAPVTGDKIVATAAVTLGVVESIDAWRVRASSVERLAVLDMGFTPTPCRADFNGDSFVNSQDFFNFLTAFFARDPSADFNQDSAINSQDFFDFIAEFFAGC